MHPQQYKMSQCKKTKIANAYVGLTAYNAIRNATACFDYEY